MNSPGHRYHSRSKRGQFDVTVAAQNTIDVGEEAWLPIVATLDNVLSNIGEIESGQARHASWVHHRMTSST